MKRTGSPIVQAVAIEAVTAERQAFLERGQQAIPSLIPGLIGRPAAERSKLGDWSATARDDHSLSLNSLSEDFRELPVGIGG
nr:hypothetical protein [Acidiphilium multivorum]